MRTMKLRGVTVDLMQMKNRRFAFELFRNVPLARQLLGSGRFDSVQDFVGRSFVKSDRDPMIVAIEPDLFDLRIFLDQLRNTRPGSRDVFHAGLDVIDVAIKNISRVEDIIELSMILSDRVFARLLTFPNVIIAGHRLSSPARPWENIAATTMDNISRFEMPGS